MPASTLTARARSAPRSSEVHNESIIAIPLSARSAALLLRQIQSQRVVLKGVQAGDRVVVDGVQRVRPNTVVAAQEAAPDIDRFAAK